MLTGISELLKKAQKEGYAVPAFNVYNAETAEAVMATAVELNSPVILQIYSRLATSGDLKRVFPYVLSQAGKLPVPVALHLDHGAGMCEVVRSLVAGATGIMIDASACPFEENVTTTRAVVELCNYVGVAVEGELGHVGTTRDETVSAYTDPAEAEEYVKKTGVSALAVMVGTAHGRYKQAPVLDIARIREIAKRTQIPLVLHGGSGVPDDQIRAAVQAGICKVNFSTDLCYSFTDACRAQSPEIVAIDIFMKEPVAACKKFAASKIELLGAKGRA